MEAKKKKILVLEDEKALSRALELKLIHEGFDVKTAQNGEHILEYIKDDVIALILCDMLMPNFDGFQVLKTLRDNNIKTPVIVLTNLSQAEDEKRVRDLGAVDFLVKSDTPITEVVNKVRKIIDNL